jgi:hypothetical protein
MTMRSSTSNLALRVAVICIGALILWVDGWSFALGVLNPSSVLHLLISLYGILAIGAAFAFFFVRWVLLIVFSLPALVLTLLRLFQIDF